MGGIDILLLIILGLVTWSVASEGIWGASLTSLIVIFSGLLAMNFFEPVAGMLEGFGRAFGGEATVIFSRYWGCLPDSCWVFEPSPIASRPVSSPPIASPMNSDAGAAVSWPGTSRWHSC